MDGKLPVDQLNELEFVNGEIYANIWHDDRIAVINPQTGRVTAWIDLAGLLQPGDEIPANFRRDLRATGLLEDTGSQRSEGPGRPGRLYRRV